MSQTILITGANRGIGLEFVRQYLVSGDTVFACCRQPDQAEELIELAETYPSQLHMVGLDLAEPKQLEDLNQFLGSQSINVLISNAGVYGPKGVALGDINSSDFSPVMNINVLAPLMLVQALRHRLTPSSKVAILSSKMGSIADNGSGGSYLYRASKAAVNAIGKSLSIDLAEQGVCVILFHPGWVQTDMGGPNALINVQTSVRGMKHVLTEANITKSGRFLNYDGNELPW